MFLIFQTPHLMGQRFTLRDAKSVKRITEGVKTRFEEEQDKSTAFPDRLKCCQCHYFSPHLVKVE